MYTMKKRENTKNNFDQMYNKGFYTGLDISEKNVTSKKQSNLYTVAC